MLPLIIGGAALFGAGYVAKKMYDSYDEYENGCYEDEDTVKEEDELWRINDWLDEKQVALDKLIDDNSSSNDTISLDEEYAFENLIQAKKRAYLGSFIKFLELNEKTINSNLPRIEFIDIDFSKENLDKEGYKEINKLSAISDVLTKSDNLLIDLNTNIGEILNKKEDFNEFSLIEQRVFKEAYSLAEFIQKFCVKNSLETNNEKKSISNPWSAILGIKENIWLFF